MGDEVAERAEREQYRGMPPRQGRPCLVQPACQALLTCLLALEKAHHHVDRHWVP